MTDWESSVTPPHVDGYRYAMTYICVTTGGPLLGPLWNLPRAEVRRGFFRCATRAKMGPMLVSSDRSREIGIFLREGFQRAPEPWGDLLPLAGFGMSNSPSKSAPSPQDLCSGWARAPPPGRESPPLDPAEREAVSDAAAAQFE